jgi:D-alanine-D-alanine ligase
MNKKQPQKSSGKVSIKKPSDNKNNKSRIRFLGPVPNLEEHVQTDWWNRIFNSLYLKTDGDVVEDINITKREVKTICDMMQFTPKDRILDLCCGQGRHSLELAHLGFQNVEGLDRSRFLIQKAKGRAKSEGLKIKFREGDASKLPYPNDSFDYVLMLGNSFGYFETIQDDLRVLKEVMRVLIPSGRLLIDISDGPYLKENYQPRSWEWINDHLFVCRERSLSLTGERLVSREVIIHSKKGVLADQFYAERLYSKEGIANLLTQATFIDVAFPLEFKTESERSQDLGMMERRIMVTSRAKKEWSPKRQNAKTILKQVAVLLGDPRKKDITKPSHIFDEDDFFTIDQIKAALRELEGYNFTFLNNHDTLITDLTKLVGKVDYVFNLCDEGYQNDPRKELHVASILECLGIPYTGGGPQCLAFCYDKSLVRGIAKEMGVPVAKGMFIKPEDIPLGISFDFPVIVKPNAADSSFGITQRSVAYNPEQLIDAVVEIHQKLGYDKPVLVEEFLQGKELTVGIIGNPPDTCIVLPITQEDYSALSDDLPHICGFEAKWCPDSAYWNLKSIPADISQEMEQTIITWSLQLADRLACRDYVRMDWRMDTAGNPKLLEVNPNPGWCWDGHLAKQAKLAGLSYSQMLRDILLAAETRLGIGLERNHEH